ncbi:EamA family transporter [Paracoccaceae bacterium GXU_MW_L88]
MGEWFVSLAGTPEGTRLAMILALLAAIFHAAFGALQKGRFDPWLVRGAMDLSYGVMAAPFALFVVPWPEPYMWKVFAGAMIIHIAYKLLQAMTYDRGAFTVVYPVVRGMGPLVTVFIAGIVFHESYLPVQWLGVALLVGGIFGLAGLNLMQADVNRKALFHALIFAFFTGIMVAAYTTYDAWGIRQPEDPFTFLAWFFFLDGVTFLPFAWRRYRQIDNPPPLVPLIKRGIAGGLIAFISFGAVMMATRLDKVGEAAVLRETSVVFAGLIGWYFLGEKIGTWRAILLCVIAGGAILVEFGR